MVASGIPPRFGSLARWMSTALSLRSVSILSVVPLSGGAIQENWLINGSVGALKHQWVLRTDAPSAVATSMTRLQEYAVLCAAYRQGVRVPEPLVSCDDPQVIGTPFFLMSMIPGVARPAAVLKDLAVEPANEEQPGESTALLSGGTRGIALGQDLAQQLARIHTIDLEDPALSFLSDGCDRDGSMASVRIAQYRNALDRLPGGYPAIDYVLTALERVLPDDTEQVVCHCDYRTGNFLVHEGVLTAVLDWEFTARGDFHEDLGWFLARCWRFGRDHLGAGGITATSVFLSAYEQASGRKVDRAAIRWWQCMAEVRWAIIALQQSQRHSTGGEDSLELALTGRMVPAMVHNALIQLQRVLGINSDVEAIEPAMTEGEKTPTEQLIATAVRTFNQSVMPSVAASVRYDAAMVRRSMMIAQRELNPVLTQARADSERQICSLMGINETDRQQQHTQVAAKLRDPDLVIPSALPSALAKLCLAELAINDPSFQPITVAQEQWVEETVS